MAESSGEIRSESLLYLGTHIMLHILCAVIIEGLRTREAYPRIKNVKLSK